jgi:hypothetical protein
LADGVAAIDLHGRTGGQDAHERDNCAQENVSMDLPGDLVTRLGGKEIEIRLVTQGDGDAADGRRDATNDSPCTLGRGCEGGILRQQRTTTMRNR